MTLSDLAVAISGAGLENLGVLPWHDRALARQLTPGVLSEIRRAYLTTAVGDLLATFATVVLRRPVGFG